MSEVPTDITLSEAEELLNNIINYQMGIQMCDEYKIKAIYGMLNEIWGNIIDSWVEEVEK